MKTKFTTYDVIVVGLMAAMVFATTFFIKIEIPTPAGPAMLKTGNIICLLAALLLGGLRGGLAAGIGSMLFDLLNPQYVASAPFTFVFFFLMAYICGKIAHSNGENGENKKLNLLGAVLGALSYIVFNIFGKNVISLMLLGSAFYPAFIMVLPKIIISLTNAVIAISVSVIIQPIIRKTFAKTEIFKKIS